MRERRFRRKSESEVAEYCFVGLLDVSRLRAGLRETTRFDEREEIQNPTENLSKARRFLSIKEKLWRATLPTDELAVRQETRGIRTRRLCKGNSVRFQNVHHASVDIDKSKSCRNFRFIPSKTSLTNQV